MNKRTIAATLLLTAAAAGTYTTYSYMNDHAQAVNEFSFVGEQGLDAVLTEPSWNPAKGLLTLPGMTIPKDPQITNTSVADLDELAAVELSFVYTDSCPQEQLRGQLLSDEDMRHVASVYTIDYNADLARSPAPDSGDTQDGGAAGPSWVRFEGEDSYDPVQHFYYRDTLERNLPGNGDTTVPLFTRLQADAAAGNEAFSHIQKIGGFDIRIKGYVLQQMDKEQHLGLNSAKEAYEAGLFAFRHTIQEAETEHE